MPPLPGRRLDAALAGLWPSERDVVQLQARPFELQDVRLLDGPFRDAMERMP